MIWNDDVLFLHVPKTGGMSVSQFLLRRLRAPVHFTNRQRHDEPARARFHEGRRHQTLAEAATMLADMNRGLDDFAVIVAGMRNPYDLEISRYHYLREGHEVDRGPAQELALANDFATYLPGAGFFGAAPPRFERYYENDGVSPENLRIVRFDTLESDLLQHVSPYLESSSEADMLTRVNTTDHDHYSRYYDAATEAVCYERHRWLFDAGFFTRRYDFDRSVNDPGQ